MSEIITERIRKVIDHYGLTVSTFADKIGVQRSNISHLLSGRNKPSLDFIMKVVQTYPSINLYWLLYGKGSFPTLENESNSHDSTPTVKEKKLPNQIVGTIEAKSIEPIRIVVFYADGTFESFDAKND